MDSSSAISVMALWVRPSALRAEHENSETSGAVKPRAQRAASNWGAQSVLLGRHVCRTKLPPKNVQIDTKKGFEKLEIGSEKRVPKLLSLANPSAPYRGQKPQNREKRVSESKNPHFPPAPEKGVSSQKIPIFPVVPCTEMGIF